MRSSQTSVSTITLFHQINTKKIHFLHITPMKKIALNTITYCLGLKRDALFILPKNMPFSAH